jgi:hypothetical protein
MTRFGRFFLQVGLFADCFVQRVVQTRGDFELPGSQLARRDGSLQRVAFSGCGADEEPSLSPLLCVAMLCRRKKSKTTSCVRRSARDVFRGRGLWTVGRVPPLNAGWTLCKCKPHPKLETQDMLFSSSVTGNSRR